MKRKCSLHIFFLSSQTTDYWEIMRPREPYGAYEIGGERDRA
jgi:hypothetical protein